MKTCELDDKVLERLDTSVATTLWSLVAQCAGLGWLKRSHVKVVQQHLYIRDVWVRRVGKTCG